MQRFAIVALLLPSIALARLEASVDATTISAADTIRLTLRADSASFTGDPDLGPLAEQFDVLGNQRSSQFRIINGQADSWTTWTLLLKPKHTGDLEIPAISLGGETSQSIRIRVAELDPRLKQEIGRTVFFETTYEPHQVYVQSQVVVSRKLFYVNGAQLYGDRSSVPDVPGAMVKPLGDAQPSLEVREGRQYEVIEQRFAVFPERSGNLTIAGATVSGSVRVDSDIAGAGRRIGVDVTAPTLTIPVLPIPNEYPQDAAWLPATDVELLQDWPGEPTRGLTTGTPSQRTLIVRVEGNTASVIPPLVAVAPESLRAYPEPPKLGETATRGGIIGTRTESISLVATRPGELQLPEVQLTWWDTVRGRVRIATLAPQTTHVTGEAIVASESAKASAPEPAPPAPAPTGDAVAPSPLAVFPTTSLWLAAAIVLVTTFCMIVVWRRRTRRPRVARVDARKLETTAHVAFTRACASRDPHRIRDALDGWLKARYALPLAAAARAFGAQATARSALTALNARLYQRDPSSPFDPAELRACVAAERRATRRPSATDELPALYPSV